MVTKATLPRHDILSRHPWLLPGWDDGSELLAWHILPNWGIDVGVFPACVRIHGAPSRACGLPPGEWRYGSVQKNRYFRWSKPRFKFRLGRLGWEDSPKKWPRDVKKNHTNQVDEEMILPKDPSLFEYGGNYRELPRFPIRPFRLLL